MRAVSLPGRGRRGCNSASDSLREARAIFLRPQAMLLVVETGRGLALAT
jgi:hypothetical protein